jgi:hypothetical protein
MYQRGPHRTELREKVCWGTYVEMLRKIKIWLKSGKNTFALHAKTKVSFIDAGDIISP